MTRRFWIVLASLVAGFSALVAPASAEYAVKVSLSRENPDLRFLPKAPAEGPVEFFLFADGGDLVGVECGIYVEGAKFLGYTMDEANLWIALPVKDPYPGTIAQVSTECVSSPACLGRLIVDPIPGENISVEVITSERAGHALVQKCDYSPRNGFIAHSAAIGTKPKKPYVLHGPLAEGEERVRLETPGAKPGSEEDESSEAEPDGSTP